jgi:hypothetical protein
LKNKKNKKETSMQKMILKPGESLVVDAIASDGPAPIDLTGYSIRSQVRDMNDQLMMNVLVLIDPDQATNPGHHTLDFEKAVTASWAEGELVCNVRYEKDGNVFSTETFGIHVDAPGVTR